jgi:hypothetical protein
MNYFENCPGDGCKCKCDHFIVLQDFWLAHIELKKGQIIHGPVSPRWVQLGLVTGYNPTKETAEKAAKEVVEMTEALSDPDIVVATDAIQDKPVPVKKGRKKTPDCPDCTLVKPEPSAILVAELENPKA